MEDLQAATARLIRTAGINSTPRHILQLLKTELSWSDEQVEQHKQAVLDLLPSLVEKRKEEIVEECKGVCPNVCDFSCDVDGTNTGLMNGIDDVLLVGSARTRAAIPLDFPLLYVDTALQVDAEYAMHSHFRLILSSMGSFHVGKSTV
jgi:hypothetical protein